MSDQLPRHGIHTCTWLGQHMPSFDRPTTRRCGALVLGCYGGNTSAGARTNEDAALLWSAADGLWEVAMVLDAHASAESAGLVLTTVAAERTRMAHLLTQPVEIALPALRDHLVSLFRSPDMLARCQRVQGETACLLVARRDRYLWWFCVGDCVVYLFHPELARLGQHALNQRGFYEWIGQRNTFALPTPCYSTGTRELRPGRNTIVLLTDGVLECGSRPFADSRALATLLHEDDERRPLPLEQRVHDVLGRVHQEAGRDSATIVAWRIDSATTGMMPTA